MNWDLSVFYKGFDDPQIERDFARCDEITAEKQAVLKQGLSVRETLEKYLYNVAGEVMSRYVERESEGIHASQEDKNIIAQFYQSALTEMVLNWIGQGMKEDGLEMITRIGQLFDGNIRASLKRSENLPVRPWKGGRDA